MKQKIRENRVIITSVIAAMMVIVISLSIQPTGFVTDKAAAEDLDAVQNGINDIINSLPQKEIVPDTMSSYAELQLPATVDLSENEIVYASGYAVSAKASGSLATVRIGDLSTLMRQGDSRTINGLRVIVQKITANEVTLMIN